MPKPLFTKDSAQWRKPKASWAYSKLKPVRPGFFGKIAKGMSASTAHRNQSIVKTPLSFAAHRGLTFLASTIPLASLLFDSLTIANIVKQFDPKFEIAPNQLTDDGYKNMLLAHVQNKVLSENHGESQQGMMMLRTMTRYAQKVSQQKSHPKSQTAREFLTHMNTAQKQVDRLRIQKRKENQRSTQFHDLVARRKFAAAPLHMQKYARPTINPELLARVQARRRRVK